MAETQGPIEDARFSIPDTLDKFGADLKRINSLLHTHPETAFQEEFAHDTLTSFLESTGATVRRGTYGIATSFVAEAGHAGRIVVFCAEYDALPQIGHACGHNLIATAALAAFLITAEALQRSGLPGRVRLLGTPAEEAGGGKALLIDAGAFADEDIAAALMCHPVCAHQIFHEPVRGYTGLAALKFIATHMFKTEWRGKTAHAAGEPWNGVNAFDAAVAAYQNVALLRQQMEPEDRVHAVMEVGGTVPNVITDYTRMSWMVRSPTVERSRRLLQRVRVCIEAGASASGCQLNYLESPTYLNLTANKTLCETYVEEMATFGQQVMLQQEKPMNASTDMGNVAHVVPSFHGAFTVPASPDVSLHSPRFADAAGTDEAHESAIQCAKGLAMTAMRVLREEAIAEGAWWDFKHNHGW
ncbi:hypothetical protein BDW62DRAFT_202947 [Aspergillus aurantiobrunneus]